MVPKAAAAARGRLLEILIVAYGHPEQLVRCLASVATYWHVVVVDNSSQSGIAELAFEAGAAYVDPGENLGFAAGVNVGLRLIDPTADVLLLNPDAFIEATVVSRLHAVLCADDTLAAISPRLLNEQGQNQRVTWPFPSPSGLWREAFRLTPAGQQGQFVIGAVCMLSRAALRQVGGFDKTFFLYYEEIDWQRRAYAVGLKSREVNECEAMHLGAGTSDNWRARLLLFHAGAETYIRKWYGATGWTSYRVAAVLGACARSFWGGSARCEARRRLVIYLRGPRRTAIKAGILPATIPGSLFQ